MTHGSWQQEQFSLAYVSAVASAAGFSTHQHVVDQDGVDLTIATHGGLGTIRSPRVDVQVKSQVAGMPAKFPWSYPLEVDNFNQLRGSDFMVPRILIVVALPKDVNGWLSQSGRQLALRHCGYWVSLRAEAPTRNTASVTVHLPKKQRFSPTQLRAIMLRVGQGGLP